MTQDPYLKQGASYKRLEEEYFKHGSLTVAVDFDGTIHDFHKEGDTYPLLHELLRDLASINCKIIVWTAYPDLTYVLRYMKEHDLPCDGVNTDGIPLPWASRKPFYSAILDDRSGLIQVFEDLELLVYKIKYGVNDLHSSC